MVAREVKRRGQSLQDAFTFMELMVVVLILGILVGMVGFGGFQLLEMARINRATTSLRTVKSAVDLFRMQHTKLPIRLKDLVERPKDITGWRPAFETKLPNDGWGFDFVYKPTPGRKHPYELYSYGGGDGPEEPAESRISGWEL